MKTVNEVSKIAGISIRTLQYYDKIGLLKPTAYSEAGYRLYSDDDLKMLQSILLYRELEFSYVSKSGVRLFPYYLLAYIMPPLYKL